MFKKIFIKLCSERGESPSAVCKKIGISSAAFSQWSDATVPRKVTQQRAADYFGVSVDYLLGNTVDVEKAPDEKPNAALLDSQNIFMIPIYENASA
jgi:transcriptional regulator with XRE-family HTH domain